MGCWVQGSLALPDVDGSERAAQHARRRLARVTVAVWRGQGQPRPRRRDAAHRRVAVWRVIWVVLWGEASGAEPRTPCTSSSFGRSQDGRTNLVSRVEEVTDRGQGGYGRRGLLHGRTPHASPLETSPRSPRTHEGRALRPVPRVSDVVRSAEKCLQLSGSEDLAPEQGLSRPSYRALPPPNHDRRAAASRAGARAGPVYSERR